MDKYQKQVKEMPDEKIVALTEGHSRVIKFSWILMSLLGSVLVIPGLYLLASGMVGAGAAAGLLIGVGVLFCAIFALIIFDYKKLAEAAVAEVFKRGLDYKVKSLQTEKQAERKIIPLIFAVFAIVALLIAIGLHSCGGDYTRCPKCGSLYDTGSGGANYITKYGECAKCDYND